MNNQWVLRGGGFDFLARFYGNLAPVDVVPTTENRIDSVFRIFFIRCYNVLRKLLGLLAERGDSFDTISLHSAGDLQIPLKRAGALEL